MKYIAIVDLPDDADEISENWVIDLDGYISYLDEDKTMMRFRELQKDIALRPLPKKKPQSRAIGRITQDRENPSILYTEMYYGYDDGFNACIDEITGEKE